jgi:hypothetical protein
MTDIYYNYAMKQLLSTDMPSLYNESILCAYTVNLTGKYPFIQYLLSTDIFDEWSLPVINLFHTKREDYKSSLINYAKVYLSGILQIKNFEEFKEKIHFDGFYSFDKKVYLFIDMSKCDLREIPHNPNIVFALIDEIVNHKSACNVAINKQTFRFFINNIQLNYLYNRDNEVYEHPIVGFVGKQTISHVKYVYTFGESAKNKKAILGPYYYFTDWHNATKGIGIIRFALFMSNTKYIENLPTMSIDESTIKKQRLNDTSLNKNYEIQTLKVSDHDGLWANKYDSVYLGNIELDDGSFVEDGPFIVLREYPQQTPLSYHYI